MRILDLDTEFHVKRQTVVCLGFFDGVHIGHRQLVERAVDVARANEWSVCVHTFDRSPGEMLSHKRDALELTPLPEKAALLAELGVDLVAVSRFDDAMMRMPARVFVRDILLEKLRAAHLVAGFHHRFGFQGEADAQMLERLCEELGLGVSIIPPVKLPDGTLVSSSEIRRLLGDGDIAKVEAMLGRPLSRDHNWEKVR